MKKTIGVALLVSVLAAAALPALAQTCNSNIRSDAPNERYQDNGDGTVLDLVTGLEWKQCSEGQSGLGCATGAAQEYSWQAALARAGAVNSAGGFAARNDWRLPSKNELASLVERRCYDPAINLGLFPTTPSGWFWSSSPDATYAYEAWAVFFYDGEVTSSYGKDGGGYVRLVRGGQ